MKIVYKHSVLDDIITAINGGGSIEKFIMCEEEFTELCLDRRTQDKPDLLDVLKEKKILFGYTIEVQKKGAEG